jgi:hypothetical protein
VRKTCEQCREEFDTDRSDTRFCGSACRARAWREGESSSSRPAVAVQLGSDASVMVPLEEARAALGLVQSVRSVEASVREQLEAVGLVESWEGAVALDLASSLDHGGQSGSARAALARELRATMGQLLRGVDEAGSRVGSMRNELAERRAKRAGGE